MPLSQCWAAVQSLQCTDMADKLTLCIIVSLILFEKVNATSYDKKTLDGMILKTLWSKVFLGYDPKIKQEGIKTLRKSGDYQKLIDHLAKVKKEKAQKLLDLIAEVIITYMS